MPPIPVPIRIIDTMTRSNCYILSTGRLALIIDPNDFAAIDSYLQMQSLQPDWVLLTHEHCDHIAGLNALRKKYPVNVLASAACSLGMQSATLNMTRIMETYLYFKTSGTVLAHYPRFTCAPADRTFSDEYKWKWQNHHCRFIPTPGHTLGSTCIIVDDCIVFTGDYFIPGEAAITRLPGGSSTAYEQHGQSALRSLPDGLLVYPGHGAPFRLTTEVKQHYGL